MRGGGADPEGGAREVRGCGALGVGAEQDHAAPGRVVLAGPDAVGGGAGEAEPRDVLVQGVDGIKRGEDQGADGGVEAVGEDEEVVGVCGVVVEGYGGVFRGVLDDFNDVGSEDVVHVLARRVVENLREVAAHDLDLSSEADGAAGGVDGEGCRSAIFRVDEGDTGFVGGAFLYGGLEAHATHDFQASASDIDILATGAEGRGALEDSDGVAGAGEEEGEDGAGDTGAGYEDFEVGHFEGVLVPIAILYFLCRIETPWLP